MRSILRLHSQFAGGSVEEGPEILVRDEARECKELERGNVGRSKRKGGRRSLSYVEHNTRGGGEGGGGAASGSTRACKRGRRRRRGRDRGEDAQ